MAIVHFVKNKRTQTVGGLQGVLNYCCKESKVSHEGRPLVSGVNCVPQCALQEFMNTKRQYGSTDGRMYYHMVQSFHPDDPVTPAMAHEIALRLAEQIPGFEIVVATHSDREHIHSHFVINSVSCDTGKKYHSNRESLEALWAASDKLCMEYGLSVVKPKKQQKKDHTMSDREYRAYDKGQSWKLNLEITVDECMTKARSREHFIRLMEYNGYEVKWTGDRKYITYTTPEGQKCRDIKMNGTKYRKEEMENEFRIRQEICCRNESRPEGENLAGRGRRPSRGRDGEELGGYDRFSESTGQNFRRDSRDAGHPDYGNATGGVYESADTDSAGRCAEYIGNPGAVPADLGARSEGHDFEDAEFGAAHGETGWEDERGIWESSLAGAGTDAEYFEEAVMDLDDPQSDLGSLGTGAAYLAADLISIVDDRRPVEDSTTKHFRPERKNRHGHTMGGM